MENREEIFDRPEAASAEGAAPVESQPRQSEETSRKAMEGLRKAGEKLSAVAAVGGILSGILSFIFGIVMLSQGWEAMQTICSMAVMPIPGSRTLRRRRPAM